MFNWAKQTLANVVGTEEPIYGPSAIRSVAEDAKTTPYTELKKEDLQWQELDSTSVETQTFYLMSDDGVHLGLAQVIYSNVAGIKTTVQFNSKITYLDGSKPPLWCSNPVSDVAVSEDKLNFYAKDCAIELSEDGNSYTIKSMTDQRCIVNLKVTKAAPGFVVGKDGKTLYGTDLKNPWGYIRHAFWPRCVAEGSMMTKDGPVDFKGLAFLTHAMQGMKPHHAAGKWNFIDFQGPTYSAILMQHTTPPSYGTTTVTVGGIAKDGEIIIANAACTATHLKTQSDSENSWPEPKDVRFTWSGTTKDGKAVEATIEGTFETRVDRVDVMAEVPVFVKKIVAGAAGTKPYIYMYAPLDFVLQLKIGDETFSEKGKTFSEATFISDTDAAPSQS
ncbi:putative Survival factor 1 [Seiridium cardinale]|uniref:Survival factor 1 n=1 Tax=Seiridium cardinale TaxID=138064 RepID=A0ABR2XS68_9PEZI